MLCTIYSLQPRVYTNIRTSLVWWNAAIRRVTSLVDGFVDEVLSLGYAVCGTIERDLALYESLARWGVWSDLNTAAWLCLDLCDALSFAADNWNSRANVLLQAVELMRFIQILEFLKNINHHTQCTIC